ncbi:MAG: tRNA-dihydrouridine synthase [Candidatus Pacebacteria bacterium]|nr:tRNA-dihydrouridine synthase [Candidatus Paceibacterota bacterium]
MSFSILCAKVAKMVKQVKKTLKKLPVMGFWAKLKKPIFVLAPMSDVTDASFRQIIAKYSRHGKKGGGPDVFWTEFVSADGLCSKGREVLLKNFSYTKGEHPIVAQIFGSKPENMKKVATLIQKLGFDGIDINMGCPDRSIEKQGAGAAMMKNPKLAQEIILATMAGAPKLPVSVKTRIGYNKDELESWIGAILETKPAVITVHARTRKELSLVPARWENVARAVKLAKGTGTLIFGNGDVKDLEDGKEKALATGADGVMLGRAVFGNPWLFDNTRNTKDITLPEKFEAMIEHTHLFEKKFAGVKNFAIMKKHYKAYANGFDGAKELRVKLMSAKNANEVEKIARKFLNKR